MDHHEELNFLAADNNMYMSARTVVKTLKLIHRKLVHNPYALNLVL